MNNIYLIIDINIDNKNYLKKSLLSIFGKTIKKNNISNIQINDNNLFVEYSENDLQDSIKKDNIKNIFSDAEKYIKNIYPEFGNDWSFSYKITNNYLLKENNNMYNYVNLCIIM